MTDSWLRELRYLEQRVLPALARAAMVAVDRFVENAFVVTGETCLGAAGTPEPAGPTEPDHQHAVGLAGRPWRPDAPHLQAGGLPPFAGECLRPAPHGPRSPLAAAVVGALDAYGVIVLPPKSGWGYPDRENVRAHVVLGGIQNSDWCR